VVYTGDRHRGNEAESGDLPKIFRIRCRSGGSRFEE
jgi:hypothetical protein